MKSINKGAFLACLLFTFSLGIFLRLYKFDTIPLGINHDGSLESLEAIEILQHPFPYKPHSETRPWLGETLFRYYLAIVFKLLSPSPKTAKLACSLISILTLPFFYLFTQSLFNKRIALFSTLFLSLSGWQIIMGKTVWRASCLPLAECFAFLFLIKAIEKKKPFFSLMAGVGIAGAINTYAAGRIIPFLVTTISFVYILKRKDRFREYLKPLLVIIASTIIFTLPLILFALQKQAVFNSRSDYLFVGNRTKEAGNLKPLIDNFKKTVTMFNIRANGDDFFVNEPLLDFPASYFFVAGLISSFFLIKKKNYLLVIICFLFSLIPGMASVPNGNRNIGVLPFVYLLAGIGLDSISGLIKSKKLHSKVITSIKFFFIFSVFILSFVNTWQLYFSNKRRFLWGFYPETTTVGTYMKDRFENHDFYLTDNYPRDALTFLTYKVGNPWIKHYTWLENSYDFLSVKPKEKRITCFIMFVNSHNQQLTEALKRKFPKGKLTELQYSEGLIKKPAGWIYEVEND